MGESVRPLQVAVLSHRGGNVGHDLMALGAEEIIRNAFGTRDYELTHLEQHRPFVVYPKMSPVRWADSVEILSARMRRRFLSNTIGERWPARPVGHVRTTLSSPRAAPILWRLNRRRFDLGFSCGGPLIVSGAAEQPNLRLILHHMPGALTSTETPVLSAAIGAAYPLERVPEHLDGRDSWFLDQAFKCATVTTVRDALALRLSRSLGHDPPLVPCTALAAGVAFERVAPHDPQYVLVNYQLHGANEDWGQDVDIVAWRRTVRDLIDRLSGRHSVAMLAHDGRERELARELAPELRLFAPTTAADYARVALVTKGAVVNRIHAALPLASVGAPSVAVGTDSRLGAVEAVGLPTMFVKNATADSLEHEIEALLSRGAEERERLVTLRTETIDRYATIVHDLAV